MAGLVFGLRLPRPEYLGQVSPRDPASVPVEDALDHRADISERAALLPSRAGHQIRDECQLVIREELEA